jgi:HrpA-like RNA helicase
MTGRDALIEKLRKNDVTVLLGETGSGKTTRALTKSNLFVSFPI